MTTARPCGQARAPALTAIKARWLSLGHGPPRAWPSGDGAFGGMPVVVRSPALVLDPETAFGHQLKDHLNSGFVAARDEPFVG